MTQGKASVSHQLQILNSSADGHGSFARVEDSIAAIRAGNMVIVVGDKDRENESDLTIAAEKVTPADNSENTTHRFSTPHGDL
jgi:hypothetical protein